MEKEYCEYCKTTNSGDEHHPGTCANCGATFERKEQAPLIISSIASTCYVREGAYAVLRNW